MFEKMLAQLFTFFVCLIPMWLFLILKAVLVPIGFAQTFLVYGLGLYIFGFIQLILLGVLVFISIGIWTD